MKAIYFDTNDKRTIEIEYKFNDPVTGEDLYLYGENSRFFDIEDAVSKIEDYLENEHALFLCEDIVTDGNGGAYLVFEDENEKKYNIEVECSEVDYMLSDSERAEIEAYEQEQERDYNEDYMTQTYFSRFW